MVSKSVEIFGFSVQRLDERGRAGVSMSGQGGKTLSEALERAFPMACFYMGPGGCRVEIDAACAACNGAGVLGATVRRKGRKCPTCKAAPVRVLCSFVAEPSKECEIWRHGERVSAPQTELDRAECRQIIARGEIGVKMADDTKSMQQLARDALAVQDACNLSGVVHGFSKAITRLWALLEAEGKGGTESVNTHPICKLWADKIAHLSGTQSLDNPWSTAAYHAVYELAGTYEQGREASRG